MKTPPGLAPFNLKDALEKRRPVVHKDGRKVVAVYHLPEAPEDSRLGVVFDDRDFLLFTENGENYPGEMPVLFHPAEPVLVPFDLAKWQIGWKAVYRDGSEPAGVVVIDNPIYPFISVGKRGESIWHLSSGECGGGQEGKRDLFLIQPEGQA